jgi:hypothetical protein
MAQLIVSGALLGIAQNVVGLVHFLELLFGARLPWTRPDGISGRAAIGLLDVLGLGVAGTPSSLVVILVFHGSGN